MQFFIHKSVSQIKTENGKKKASFKIIKGKNGEIHQIKGITSDNNPDILNIRENIQKLDKESGIIRAKHRVFKIKSSDISTLLKDNSPKENSLKTIHLKVKKPIKLFEKEEDLPVKKIVKKEVLPVKKTVKKEVLPVKKIIKKEILPVKKTVKKRDLSVKKVNNSKKIKNLTEIIKKKSKK
jgi:hypothetical protein